MTKYFENVWYCGGRRVPLKGPPQAAAPHESKSTSTARESPLGRHRADCFAPVGAPQRALAPTSRLAADLQPRGTNGPRRAKRDLPNTELPMQCTVNGVTSVHRLRTPFWCYGYDILGHLDLWWTSLSTELSLSPGYSGIVMVFHFLFGQVVNKNILRTMSLFTTTLHSELRKKELKTCTDI